MLTFSLNNIRDKFNGMPMAMMAIPFIVGIIVSYNYHIPIWIWVAIFSISLMLTILQDNFIFIAIFSLGAITYHERSYDMLPQGAEADLILKITDNGIDYGRYSTFDAKVYHYNGQRCIARIKVTADSLTFLRRGDILEARTTIRPFGKEQNSYVRSMHRQGYSGRATVNEYQILWWKQNHRESLHELAINKLQSLLPRSNGTQVAMSLALGAKQATDRDVKRNYSLSGVSHLLAVSGLHVGIVAMLFSLLLLPLSFIWRGNSIRAWIIIALIWVYVALCGFPTSAIRAAIMFSILQISHLTHNRYSQENSIFTAALFML